ncbi:hypothetical protein JTE90_025394 [Oedothorax gibbosus]|uniref:Double-strand-break repair protein rad21-like protein 1 n=1 Tax=Oedothorax gibbosus TaxID=931172 RepID=A0AAV6UIM0_9ARAC|nr:hypothetical protein JTE90_025394 [Oedothorax gibbosus]
MVLFFTNLLLGGKNDLKKVWLAAHWEKKLKRYQITQINIESSVEHMMTQEIILDLRLSGHLLVGIVRIFSRKTTYLLNECSDIFNRVRIFREVLTDLPLNRMQARLQDITLPEALDDLNFEKINDDAIFSSNQAQSELITLKETVANSCLINDDLDELNFEEERNEAILEDEFELLSLFNEMEDKENFHRKVSDVPKSAVINCGDEINYVDADEQMDYCNEEGYQNGSDNSTHSSSKRLFSRHISVSQELILLQEKVQEVCRQDKIDLEPLTDFTLNSSRKRRKRKLIIDEVKMMDKEKMKRNYYDNSDIVVPLDLAPPLKRLMVLKEIGQSEKIFRLPGQKMGSHILFNLFVQKLKTYKTDNKEESSGDEDSHASIPHSEPRGEALFGEDLFNAEPVEQFVTEPMEINEPENFAEGMIGNDVELSIELSDSLVHKSGTHKANINFSSELQFDFSVSENTTENIHFMLQDRIVGLLEVLKLEFQDINKVSFRELVRGERKKMVARAFLSVLMLKKFSIVQLRQENAYDDILITPDDNFDPACNELCQGL